MSSYPLRCAVVLGRTDVALFVREPLNLFFAFAFPLILVLFVGSVGGAATDAQGTRFVDAYAAMMVGVTASLIGIVGRSIHYAEDRSSGALRRFKLSPMPAGTYFAAQFLSGLAVLGVSVVALTSLTGLIYGSPPETKWLPFGVASVVGLFVCTSIGNLLGGMPLPVRSVRGVTAAVFFVLFLTSGAVLPRASFPTWLSTVSEYNPLTILNLNLVNEYTGAPGGQWSALGVLVLVALGLNAISARVFDREE